MAYFFDCARQRGRYWWRLWIGPSVLNELEPKGRLFDMCSPWIFRQIEHFLATGHRLADPGISEIRDVALEHLRALHQFYGADTGVRLARKHIGWFASGRPNEDCFWHAVNKTVDCDQQLRLVADFLTNGQTHPGAPLAA